MTFRIWCSSLPALALIALGVLPAVAQEGDGVSKPNILFIAIDDLNDWSGAMGGNPQSITPNLDRLAASGTMFTNAHCAAPACNPSRAALMTGIRPSTSGVYFNSQRWRASAVLKDAYTLPQWLAKHGYSTRGAGKILHGGFQDPQSWQEYWPSQTKSKPGDPMPAKSALPLNGIPKTSHFDWGPVDAVDEEMGDWQVAEWIGKCLGEENAGGQPFFLACGFYRPHLPWFVPQKYFDKFPLDSIVLPESPDGDLDDVPAAGVKMAKPEGDHAKVLAHDQWKQAVQGYLASIHFVDVCLGKVLDALDKGPYADNTIVVLWSDHGWHLGEKQHWRKFALWEEATRVQMTWRVPGMTKAGAKCTSPVNLLDIYPTLVDLVGVPENDATEGVSLKPLLEDAAAEWNRPTLTTHGRNNHAVRSAGYRYIHYADGGEELYHLRKDPMEYYNLAGSTDPDAVAVKKRLARALPEKNRTEDPSLKVANSAGKAAKVAAEDAK